MAEVVVDRAVAGRKCDFFHDDSINRIICCIRLSEYLGVFIAAAGRTAECSGVDAPAVRAAVPAFGVADLSAFDAQRPPFDERGGERAAGTVVETRAGGAGDAHALGRRGLCQSLGVDQADRFVFVVPKRDGFGSDAISADGTHSRDGGRLGDVTAFAGTRHDKKLVSAKLLIMNISSK